MSFVAALLVLMWGWSSDRTVASKVTRDGSYARLGAHGFYWTATEINRSTAWFYNFGKGSALLNHHDGEKERAFGVRCVRPPVRILPQEAQLFRHFLDLR
jgi:hypothetical protein